MKVETHHYPVYTLTNGEQLSIDMITLDSEKPGPVVYFQANVHGAELQGNLVIKEIMEYFSNNPFEGCIKFIPFANPQGSTQTLGGYTYGRFNPRTGDNWNRNYLDLIKLKNEQMSETLDDFVKRCSSKPANEIADHYKSFIRKNLNNYLDQAEEYGVTENKKLFVILQIMASDADVIFDLHTGSTATRYLYAAEYEKEWAKKVRFPHTLIIPNEFAGAMDEACFSPWVALRDKLKASNIDFEIPIQSFTVELGSEEVVCSKDAKKDALRLLHFLKDKGVHNNKLEEFVPEQYVTQLSNFKSYYSPTGGLCEYHIKPAEHFKKGDTLATIHNLDRQKGEWIGTPIKANKDGILVNRCATSNVGQGHNLFQVMEEYTSF